MPGLPSHDLVRSMKFHVPYYIQSLIPYVPGKSIQETQREYGISKVIKLASNENPLGPCPKALQAMRQSLSELHRYPDPSGFELKQTLTQIHAIGFSSLALGNGSNELIDNLIRTFCVSGDMIVTSQFSFIAYQISAQIHGVSTLHAEVDSRFKIKMGDLISKVRDNERVKLVFIANPNNPTGAYVTTEEMNEFVAQLSEIRGGSVLLVLDYAYWEYVRAPDLPDPHGFFSLYPNIVILRTFSKVFGLAGLRVGYAIASPEVIGSLEKVRQPFNMNSLALKAASAALTDQAFVEASVQVNQAGMRLWEDALRRLKIPYIPSQGNFILVNMKEAVGVSGMKVYQVCLAKGVVFRPLANYSLPDYLRISMGSAEENTSAIKVLETAVLGFRQESVREGA